jgi:hypothetical protein
MDAIPWGLDLALVWLILPAVTGCGSLALAWKAGRPCHDQQALAPAHHLASSGFGSFGS